MPGTYRLDWLDLSRRCARLKVPKKGRRYFTGRAGRCRSCGRKFSGGPAKIASVTIEYEPADDTSATEILKAKEDKLKIFIAEKSSGNGVRENGQGNYPAISTKIKTVSDGGGYITFMCELKGADVPMIYYKDTQQFAFQPADSAPGRTNGYQVLTEEN